jgi:hypothetical protein
MGKHCYFEYCVYQKDNVCILGDMEINSLGMCDTCEVVNIHKNLLVTLKKQRLDEISERWACEGYLNFNDVSVLLK